MAITSVGYGGTVDYPDYGKGVVTPGRYTFDGPTDFRPSRVTGGSDRTVRVAGGTAQGYGIRDTEDATSVNVQLGSISSGSRWDLIVLRRDWSAGGGTGLTSIETIAGGSSEAIPSRNTDPGVLDDQPIALARVQAGQQYVTDVIDLRCWAADGGLVAVHTRALDYLDTPGTRVSIGAAQYTRVLSAAGAARWERMEQYAPSDTGWIASTFSAASNWTGTREYRVIDGNAYLRIQGSRQGSSLVGADFQPMTMPSWARPTGRPVYGACWVGSNSYRAYINASDGIVHVNPMTINQGNTFQVYITWPVG